MKIKFNLVTQFALVRFGSQWANGHHPINEKAVEGRKSRRIPPLRKISVMV